MRPTAQGRYGCTRGGLDSIFGFAYNAAR